MEADLRAYLVKLLAWEDAHVGFERAVKGVSSRYRGLVPPGGEHSIWQLVEHIRLAQADILEFCVSPRYKEKKWPDEYWPKQPAPRDAATWNASLAGERRDRRVL